VLLVAPKKYEMQLKYQWKSIGGGRRKQICYVRKNNVGTSLD